MLRLLLIVLSCYHLAAVITANGNNRAEEVCQQFTELFRGQQSQISVPGKRGVAGPKGPPGAAGPPGPQGICDHDRCDQKIAEAKLALEAKFNEKLAQLEEKLNSKISQLETASRPTTAAQTTPTNVATAAGCEIRYNNKCFRSIFHNSMDVDLAAAETMCYNIGWKLANLYSMDHYNMLANHFRKVARRSFTILWLGMTYDQSTKTLHYSNGTRNTETLLWYNNNPRHTSATFTKMTVVVRTDPQSKYNGMINLPGSERRHGAFCEL